MESANQENLEKIKNNNSVIIKLDKNLKEN